jgi:hypothetical protein
LILAGSLNSASGRGAQVGLCSRNGKNRTLSLGEHPEQPELTLFNQLVLPPDVVAGQVDVLPAQGRQMWSVIGWYSHLDLFDRKRLCGLNEFSTTGCQGIAGRPFEDETGRKCLFCERETDRPKPQGGMACDPDYGEGGRLPLARSSPHPYLRTG